MKIVLSQKTAQYRSYAGAIQRNSSIVFGHYFCDANMECKNGKALLDLEKQPREDIDLTGGHKDVLPVESARKVGPTGIRISPRSSLQNYE